MRFIFLAKQWRSGICLLALSIVPAFLDGVLAEVGAHFVLKVPADASFTQDIDNDVSVVRLLFPGLTAADFNSSCVHHTLESSSPVSFSVQETAAGSVFVLDVSAVKAPVVTLLRIAYPSQLLVAVYDKPVTLYDAPVVDHASLKMG